MTEIHYNRRVASLKERDWYPVAEPIVQGIVRDKLGVTLSQSDARRDNEDALDLVQNIFSELTERFQSEGSEIRDVAAYTAVVAYHACAQYIRNRYPEHARLKNKIRYFLSHEPGFAVWETPEGDVCCGYSGSPRDGQSLDRARQALLGSHEDISEVLFGRSAGAFEGVKALDSMRFPDWRKVVDRIFYAIAPMQLDQLISILSALFRVKEQPKESGERLGKNAQFDRRIHHQELMQMLWMILQDFDHRWLMAFLLNLPGFTKEARGEIDAFETSEAATRQEIGILLAMNGDEYSELGYQTEHWAPDPGDHATRMCAAWPFLPREDMHIAKALRCRTQQVINLRAVAVQKAALRLEQAMRPKIIR
jgi:hypothetical protein